MSLYTALTFLAALYLLRQVGWGHWGGGGRSAALTPNPRQPQPLTTATCLGLWDLPFPQHVSTLEPI